MKTKGLNAFQLKLLMAVLMVFDHLEKIPGLLSGEWASIFHALTRCVAVWFAFAAVEGFLYTRSRLLYNMRLFFWSAIMFAGNTILNLLFQSKGVQIYNNIFLTLACGVLVLNIFFGINQTSNPVDIKRQPIRFILGIVVCLLAGYLYLQGKEKTTKSAVWYFSDCPILYEYSDLPDMERHTVNDVL